MKEFKFISKKTKDKIKLFSSEDDVDLKKIGSSIRTEINSNEKLITEGCIGVVDYTDYYIKFRVKKGYMVVNGNNLQIVFFENKTIEIKGKITNIEYLL